VPSIKRQALPPSFAIPHGRTSAGNMAIQRAAAGPLAGNPAAPAILGGANMSTGGCSCGGTCEECKTKAVQRKAQSDTQAAPSAFDGAVAASGAGAPLGPHSRSLMENRFADKFDDVRIHDDSSAADAARSINAHAFTMGRDVYFARGRYEPHTTAGQKLIAHELTHVLQQRRGAVAPGLKSLNATAHDDQFENEAEQVEASFDRADHSTAPTGIGHARGSSGTKDHVVQRKCAKCSAESSSSFGNNSLLEEKKIQRKCACRGTCSTCAAQSAASSQELKKEPVQRKPESLYVSQKANAEPLKNSSDPAPAVAIQRKCACGGTCSKCSGGALAPDDEAKTSVVQRKADESGDSMQAASHSFKHEAVAPREIRPGQPAKAAPQRAALRPTPKPGNASARAADRKRPATRGHRHGPSAPRAEAGRPAVGPHHDRFEREADVVSEQVMQGRTVSRGISSLDRERIQRYSFSDFVSDVEDTLDKTSQAIQDTAEEVADEASDIATGVWDAASALADRLSGALSYVDNLLVVTIPPMHVCDPHSLQFNLPEIGKDIPFLKGILPIDPPELELYGELGLHLGLIPEISLQLGPCETRAITIAIHPISMEAEVSGGFDLTLALGLGAEARVGIYGEVGVMVVWPDPPVVLQIPVARIEAGLAGFARGILADKMSVDFAESAGISGFSFSQHRTDDLGFALDLGLAGYGALSLLGFNICTLYWPFDELHKDATLSLELDLGLDINSLGDASLAIGADEPVFNDLDWSDLGVQLNRDTLKDNCPLCDFLRSLGLMPSQLGGPWPFHPTPPWPGPLPGVYPIDPGDMFRGWHGGLCRGACGLDCTKCKDIGDVFVCEPVGDHHRIVKYSHFNLCPTHKGCRDHDACYDWCANKLFERGPLGVIFGPCHRMCDLECVCDYSLPDCVGWIFGKGGDAIMAFSDRPEEIGGCVGPCPTATKDPTGATSLKTCLPDIPLFDRVSVSDGFFRKTPKFPVIKPLIFDVYGIPVVVTVDAFASLEAFLSAGLGPAVLKKACLELDLATGDYNGTAELHVFADILGLVQIIGALEAELSVACFFSVLKVKPKLIATGSGKLDNDLFAKVEISCCGGEPVLKGTAGLTPCLTLAFDLDAALDVDLFGFNLFSEIWKLAHKDWNRCWPMEFDVFSFDSCGKGASSPLRTVSAPAAHGIFGAGGAQGGRGATSPTAGHRSTAVGPRAPTADVLLGPHDLEPTSLLTDLFALASHDARIPEFPADPAADHHMANPCPVPSAPTGLSCADAIHMRWFKPNDIYPNPIKLDGIDYAMVGPKPAPPPDTAQNVGVSPPFMPSIGKCLQLDPQPRIGNQARYRSLLEKHGFSWSSPKPLQPDHVQDVFWKGPDRFDNLWPLDAFKNQSAGSRQNLHQEIRFAEHAGGSAKVMSLKEFKKTQWEPDPSHKRRFFKIDEIAF